MATIVQDHNEPTNMSNTTSDMTHGGVNANANGGHGTAAPVRKPYDYGGNPLARLPTHESVRLPAFGGEFQPGSYAPSQRKFANPAPLGLSAFALTTFILSLINRGARDVTGPNLVVASAYAYGGLVQLLAGMWYAPGNMTR